MHFMIISVSRPPILFLVMIIQVLFRVLSLVYGNGTQCFL